MLSIQYQIQLYYIIIFPIAKEFKSNVFNVAHLTMTGPHSQHPCVQGTDMNTGCGAVRYGDTYIIHVLVLFLGRLQGLLFTSCQTIIMNNYSRDWHCKTVRLLCLITSELARVNVLAIQ